jgi:hypothetical protein
MRSFILLLTCLELAAQMAAQAGTPHFAQPMPMPAALHRFTEVFFNANHTLALVEEGMWCGSLCGNWTWVVLERRDGRWQMMPWVNATAVS